MICEHCNRHIGRGGRPGRKAEVRAVDLARLSATLTLCAECDHRLRECPICGKPIRLRCRCCGKSVSGRAVYHPECAR